MAKGFFGTPVVARGSNTVKKAVGPAGAAGLDRAATHAAAGPGAPPQHGKTEKGKATRRQAHSLLA